MGEGEGLLGSIAQNGTLFNGLLKRKISTQALSQVKLLVERPGLIASRFMAEWRSMRGEDSTMQDMLLAMWAQPSPSQHILLIYTPQIALQLHLLLLRYRLLLDLQINIVLFFGLYDCADSRLEFQNSTWCTVHSCSIVSGRKGGVSPCPIRKTLGSNRQNI